MKKRGPSYMSRVTTYLGREPKIGKTGKYFDPVHVHLAPGRTSFNHRIVENPHTQELSIIRGDKSHEVVALRINKKDLSLVVLNEGREETWKIPKRLNR